MIKDSIVSYPKRGPFGDNKFRGNTSGYLIRDLILEYRAEGIEINKVLDPMEGSGTARDVCEEMGIEYTGLDLTSGFDLTLDEIPDKDYDMIFLHPPYYKMIKYSDDERDLSNIKDYTEFINVLRHCMLKCFRALRDGGLLVLQIGDYRKAGKYYFMIGDLNFLPKYRKGVLIKRQHNVRSSGYFYGSKKFIPIKHEYIGIWQRKD